MEQQPGPPPARALGGTTAAGDALVLLLRRWHDVAAETLPGDHALTELLTARLRDLAVRPSPPQESELLEITEEAVQHAIGRGAADAARQLSKRLRRSIYEYLLSLDAMSAAEQPAPDLWPSQRTDAAFGGPAGADRPELVWDEPELRVLDGGAKRAAAAEAPADETPAEQPAAIAERDAEEEQEPAAEDDRDEPEAEVDPNPVPQDNAEPLAQEPAAEADADEPPAAAEGEEAAEAVAPPSPSPVEPEEAPEEEDRPLLRVVELDAATKAAVPRPAEARPFDAEEAARVPAAFRRGELDSEATAPVDPFAPHKPTPFVVPSYSAWLDVLASEPEAVPEAASAPPAIAAPRLESRPLRGLQARLAANRRAEEQRAAAEAEARAALVGGDADSGGETSAIGTTADLARSPEPHGQAADDTPWRPEGGLTWQAPAAAQPHLEDETPWLARRAEPAAADWLDQPQVRPWSPGPADADGGLVDPPAHLQVEAGHWPAGSPASAWDPLPGWPAARDGAPHLEPGARDGDTADPGAELGEAEAVDADGEEAEGGDDSLEPSWSVRRSPRQQVHHQRMAVRRRDDVIRAAAAAFDQSATNAPRRQRLPELVAERLPEQIEGLLRRKRAGEAAALVQRAAQEIGGRAVADLALECGDRCRDRRQARAAINSYLAAWRADPVYEVPLWRLAETCLEDDETELAVGYLERIADLMRAGGDDEAAIEVYRKVIAIAPDRGDVRALLQTAQSLGRFPD